MSAVIRWVLLSILALSSPFVACSSLEPEKQWYKASQSYTVADFDRDRAACTKDRVLDDECMKARGWTSLSGDEYKPPARPHTGVRGRNY